jgi:endonuclease/exonuclease/phosphatase family metal-dependent hydrolase
MKLTILNWNLYWKSSIEPTLAFIKTVNADILCLQEVTKDSEANPGIDIPELIAKLGYEYHYVPTIERRGDRHKIEGIGLFGKYAIKSVRRSFINKGDAAKHDASNYDRVYLEGVFETPGGSVTVGTTQLSYSPFFEMTEPRKAEGNRLIEAIGLPQKRFVFSGDLNAAPDSYIVQSLRKLLVKTDPIDEEPSFPTMPFQYHDTDHRADPFTWRLDYMLATEDMKVLDTAMPLSMASDHLPIVTVFEL